MRNETYRRVLVPLAVGLAGAAGLVALYLSILTLLQSPEHALGQLSQDRVWVGLVALGFGAQLGLYAYLRQIIAEMTLAGASALTGVGTGTSTAGMIACCAHHLADVAPLVGLTGASGLSGVVSFFGEYRPPIILLGLVVNSAGSAWSVRTIRKQRAHLRQMLDDASPIASSTGAACHQA